MSEKKAQLISEERIYRLMGSFAKYKVTLKHDKWYIDIDMANYLTLSQHDSNEMFGFTSELSGINNRAEKYWKEYRGIK